MIDGFWFGLGIVASGAAVVVGGALLAAVFAGGVALSMHIGHAIKRRRVARIVRRKGINLLYPKTLGRR